MRYKEIIERKDISDKSRKINQLDFPTLLKTIETKCRPWLAASENGAEVVYRGVKNAEHLGSFIKKTRTDRKPLDSVPTAHEIYNTLLQHAGSKANRSNSVFTTGYKLEAAEYGKVYIVFPIGEFNYVWSPKYEDWTREFDYHDVELLLKPEMFAYAADHGEIHNGRLSMPILLSLIDNKNNFRFGALDKILKVNKDLVHGINSGHEIMIQCESALYITEQDYNKLTIGSIS